MANTKIPVELSSTPGIVDNSNATAITIDSSENVQIGSNSFTEPRLQLYGAGTAESQIFFGNDGTNGFKDGAIRYFHESHATTANRRAMTFSTGITERMRIDSSGRVGIGTSSPDAKLDVYGDDVRIRRNDNQYFQFAQTSGGQTLTTIGGTNKALTIGTADNNAFKFHTNNTERMRIDSSGNLLVGASDQAWGTSSGFRVNSAGQAGQFVTITNTSSTATDEALIVHRQAAVTNGEAIQFYRAGASVGSITLSSGSTSYNTSSDYRLKTNIQDMQDNGVERVKKLRPVTFNWIEDDNGTHEGFIAHEIQEAGWNDGVVGVKDDEERKQSVDYGRITPLLVKAIQEQQTQIDALQSEINELKNS